MPAPRLTTTTEASTCNSTSPWRMKAPLRCPGLQPSPIAVALKNGGEVVCPDNTLEFCRNGGRGAARGKAGFLSAIDWRGVNAAAGSGHS
jgi:hypothetical protein